MRTSSVNREAEIEKGSSASKALAAAKVNGIRPPQNVKVDRATISRRENPAPPPVVLMFSMVEGSAKALRAPQDRGWLVVALKKVIAGDASKREDLVKASSAQFKNFMGQEYAQQFIRAAREEVGIKRNTSAIEALRKKLLGLTN